ncbi:MAG: hypothetical protein QM820_61995 [Minicystis sp.]
MVILVVKNPGSTPVRAGITVRADDGTPRQGAQRFDVAQLDAGQSTVLTIPMSGFGLRTTAMAHAGQILASASAVPIAVGATGGTTAIGPAAESVAPIIYYHRDPATSALIAYGGQVLHDQYHGGDLTSSAPDEPDTFTVRVRQGEALPYGADLLVEAGTPSEGNGTTGSTTTTTTTTGSTTTTTTTTTGSTATGAGAGYGGPGTIGANVYALCIKWDIRLTDSGKQVVTTGGDTITEDYWNDPGGAHVVTARGVRVRLTKGSFNQVFDTDPTTGCFTFTHPGGGPFDLRVYAYGTDANGNVTRVRDTQNKTFSFLEKGIVPVLGTPLTVTVGSQTPRATLAAIAQFSAYRTSFGLTNKQIDIEEVNTCGTPNGNNSSAHYNFGDLDDGLAHVRIHDGTGATCSASDHRRQKFVVSHELGHAWMLLHTETKEPAVDTTLADPQETACTTNTTSLGYTPNSLEWSGVGAREGMGHFYATLVWNSPSTDEAVFSFFGSPANMEVAGPCGGSLQNVCNTPNKAGKSVNMDWARFYWHWFAPLASDSPSLSTMRNVYGKAITDGGLTKDNYYDKLREALEHTNVPSSVRFRWDHYGLQDGPSGYACPVPFEYTNCQPGDPPGFPGCPCADVTQTTIVTDFGDDGHYPDGEGSYLTHGLYGVGQFCRDAIDGRPEGSVVCGQVMHQGSPVPICQTCGVDTMVGCPCARDEECGALGDDMICWGATHNLASESNWKSDLPGRCMPTSANPAGRERLSEVPWICLDNCGAKAGGGPGTYVCAYDQLLPLAHAQCIDALASFPAYCESKGQWFDPDNTCGDPDGCCDECSATRPCTDLGFPASYQCDMNGEHGHCVPDGCANPKTLPSDFCSMF